MRKSHKLDLQVEHLTQGGQGFEHAQNALHKVLSTIQVLSIMSSQNLRNIF